MIENVALIAGIIGIVFSILTLIALFLLKKNILDILRKDALIFDKNFELKQKAITESLNIVDEVFVKGKGVILNASFQERSKKCYNELICVLNNTKLADAFYDITLNPNSNITFDKLHIFKMLSRKDLGFKITKLEFNMGINSTVEQATTQSINTNPVQQPAQKLEPKQNSATEAQTQVAQQHIVPRPQPATNLNTVSSTQPINRTAPTTTARPITRSTTTTASSTIKSDPTKK